MTMLQPSACQGHIACDDTDIVVFIAVDLLYFVIADKYKIENQTMKPQ